MSDYLLRKYETFFERFDRDHDGEITVRDFDLIAEKLMEGQLLDEKRGNKLKSAFREVFILDYLYIYLNNNFCYIFILRSKYSIYLYLASSEVLGSVVT